MIMLKLGPDASAIEVAAFIASGPFGITASMCFHHRTLGKRRRRRKTNINCGADRP